MGINGGHKLTYQINNISFNELLNIAKFLRSRNRNTAVDGTARSVLPSIDIDASWLVRSSRLAPELHVSYIIQLALFLSRNSFDVVICCDGTKRHHSKRSTIERQSKLYRCQVDYRVTKCALMNSSNSIELRKKLENKLRSIETKLYQGMVSVGDELFFELLNNINDITYENENFGIVTVLQAEFQADSLMAYRVHNQLTELSMSSDTDLAAHAGEACVGISKFKFKFIGSNSKMDGITLFSPSQETIQNIGNSIYLPLDSDRLKNAVYPLFDKVQCPRLRALIVVGLGCDVVLGGVKNVTPSSLHNSMKNRDPNTSTYSHLFDFYIKSHFKNNNNVPESEKQNFVRHIEICIDAFLFEPANFYTNKEKDKTTENIYMNSHLPTYLHAYIKEFARGNENVFILPEVDCCRDLATCVGPGSGEHDFIKYEGLFKCAKCGSTICTTCKFCELPVDDITMQENTNRNNDEKLHYCVNCFSTSSVNETELTSELIPVSEMLRQLAQIGSEMRSTDTISDILDVYEARFVTNNVSHAYCETSLMSQINTPLLSASYLPLLPIVTEWIIMNGGRYIQDDALTIPEKVNVTKILVKLVELKQKDINEPKLYSILPEIICDFAKSARIGSGYRLLARTVRHAMDPMCNEIKDAHGYISRHANKVVLVIKHTVKSSMKSDVYKVEVAFNHENIVACSCTCKAGACNNERVLCVHILPVLFQLSQEMFQYLSQHILVEWTDVVSRINTNEIDQRTLNKLDTCLRTLIKVEKNEVFIDNNQTLETLLSNYCVATQQAKKRPHTRQILTNVIHGPLREVDFRSAMKKAKDLFESYGERNGTDNNDLETDNNGLEAEHNNDLETSSNDLETDNNEQSFSTKYNCETYKKIVFCCVALCKLLKTRSSTECISKLIGFQLILHRSGLNESEMMNIKVVDRDITREAKTIIKLANEENRKLRTNKNRNNSSNNLPNHRNDRTNNHGMDDDNHDDGAEEKIKRYCCSVCKQNNIRDKTITFSRIPEVTMKNIDANASDKIRKTYFTRVFRRNIYLERFKIISKSEKRFLVFCEKHELCQETFDVPWIDISGNENINLNVSLIVPTIQDNNNMIRTRLQQSIRQPFDSSLDGRRKRKKNPTSNATFVTYPSSSRNNRRCCFAKCCCRVSDDNITFQRIPPLSKQSTPTMFKSNFERMRIAVKNSFRNECLRRCGLRCNDPRSELRICNQHRIEKVRHLVRWDDLHGIRNSTYITMNLPSSEGIQRSSTPTRVSNGLGTDRQNIRVLNQAIELLDEFGEQNADMWGTLLSQSMLSTASSNHEFETQQHSMGIDMMNIRETIISKQKKKEYKTIIRIDDVNDKQIKSRTGFPTLTCMICYLVFVNKGEFKEITKTTSHLTWFEEWLVYYDLLYGRKFRRMEDAMQYYGMSKETLERVFKFIKKKVKGSRNDCPRYASLDEDSLYRKEKWDTTYKNVRLVMWDTTDAVRIYQSTDAHVQRLTYNKYYNGNVGKGGIFIQPCGWMGTHEIWTGGVSDSEYFINSGILQQQEEYLQEENEGNEDISFSNMLDKGFRVVSQCWNVGRQIVIQPNFSRSDRRFTSYEVIRSAAVASDRGGNERAVKYSKMTGLLTKGFLPNQNCENICDAWLVWSYQCNFMYEPPL